MRTEVADSLIRAAYGHRHSKVNVSSLARAVGVSPQNLHRYWTGRIPWPADVAFMVLAASGNMGLDARGLNVKGAVPARVLKLFTRIAGQGFELKRQS